MAHLDSDQIAAYATGRLRPDERAALEEHLADCATCRHEVAAVRPLVRGSSWRPARIAAAAATAAALVLVFLPLRPAREAPGTEPVLRPGAEAEGITRLGIRSPPPAAALDRADLRFAWVPDGPDALYEITVTDSAGVPVWRARTPDTTAIPPNTLSLLPGATYHWWVDVLLRDARMATTGVHAFRIAP